MHEFCQYPVLVRLLDACEFRAGVHVLAIGKAAWKMASLGAGILRDRQAGYDGFVLTTYGSLHGPIAGLKLLEAGHPHPDANSLKHSAAIVSWLKKLPEGDDLIILLSGGGSALFEKLPGKASLHDLRDLNDRLLKSGLDIQQMNRERTQLSLVKGGKALKYINCGRIRIYAVSDVAGNDPHVIASGPFTPPWDGRRSGNGYAWEEEKRSVEYQIVGDNLMFRRGLKCNLEKKGLTVLGDSSYQSRSAATMLKSVTAVLDKALSGRYRLKPPFIYMWGGETPVKVRGKGLGGRCSHLAASMATLLPKANPTAFFCFATDGCDGVPRSGGAYADRDTCHQLNAAHIHRKRTLDNCDTYTALKAIHHILPAPLITTNVNDIILLSVGYGYDFDYRTELPVDDDQLCIC
jgi:hydroxypyruvate reductase